MRRVLLVPASYLPDGGGVQEICRNLAAQLTRRGYEVAIAVNRNPLTLPGRETIDGVDVERFDFHCPNRSLSGIFSSWRILFAAVSFLFWVSRTRPDVVHVICPSASSIFVWLAKMLFQFKLLVTFQGELFMDATGIYERSAFARWSLARLLSVCDGTTYCSKFVQDDACAKYALNQLQQKIIFNGVDLSEQPRAVGQKLPERFILAAGRIVQNKGFDALLQAFGMIVKNNDSLALVIAGGGEYENDLKRKTKQMGLADRVIFTGWLGRGEVTAIFQRCLFFVMPSPVEPFGIVCLEALRAGKAQIATNRGGPPEFLTDGFDALVIEPDAPAMAQAMSLLLTDSSTRSALEINALGSCLNFDWQKISTQYEQMYNML